MILFVMLSSMLYTRYYSPMSRSSRESSNPINPSVLIFPLIVGLIGWFVMSKTTPVVPSNTPTVAPSLSSTSSSMTVLLGSARQDAKQDELFVYDVDAGQLMSTTTASGWRLPLSSMVSVTRRSEDSVWLLQGSEWSVSLRNTRGHAYQDPLPIGVLDPFHVALVATASDRRVVLSVSRAGVIRELLTLEQEAQSLVVHEGKVWGVESAPREGIEMPPRGPSRVWTVGLEQPKRVVLEDARVDTTITRIVVGQAGEVAFGTDAGDFFSDVIQGMSEIRTKGTPLGWVDHTLVIIRDGRLCSVIDAEKVVCGSPVSTEMRWIGPVLVLDS
jgi:hypothetical protein